MNESPEHSHAVGPSGGESQPPEEPSASERPPRGHAGMSHQLSRRVEGAKRHYEGSSAERLWQRLDAMDFINRGMLFAAILLLCFFPFVIVVNALAGRSTVTELSRRLGLNHQAAGILSKLFTSSASTSRSLSGAGYILFILGGIAAASAIQELYERSFGVESRGMRDILRRLVWLGVLIGVVLFIGWVGPHLHHAGGPVLLVLVLLVLLTAFWEFTMWFLLAGRVPWRDILPSAIATAVCWIGMEVVFTATFSNTVISNDKKYGTIGVVFALMSWLIAIGVVIILGAIIGVVWRERGLSFRAAFRRLRHQPSEKVDGGPAVASRTGSGDDAAAPQVGERGGVES